MGKLQKKAPFKKKSTPLKKKPVVTKKMDTKAKSKPAAKHLNPFEIKINKQKFQVLGRPTKHERGLPGVSRAKAQKKRHQTLLVEYQNRFKANKFVDRRLGEKDPKLSVEGKMEMRFLAEQIKSHNKKSKFLLGDDEVLTHRGQTLADVEKFDDPRSESEDDDEARLGEDFVKHGHFGGGFLKKGDDSEAASNNRESVIDNLIAESKKRKEERQKEREETDELTDKLDLEYKECMDLLMENKMPKKGEAEPVKLPDSAYDLLVRELRFDARVTPSNKLQSSDEIAKLEKEKLERLEAERLKRMNGDVESSKKIPHRSADDLDDCFVYKEKEVEVKPLSFRISDPHVANSDAAEKSVSEPEEDADDDVDAEDAEHGSEEDSGSEAEDSYSDLESSNGEEDSEVPEKVKVKASTRKTASKLKEPETLPFVFQVPDEYEEFHELLHTYSEKQHRTILERMIKCNHSALDGNNKPKMEKLFTFVMQYIHDLSTDYNLSLLNDLAPVAFDLAQIVPSNSVAGTLLDVLLEKREEFAIKGRKRPISIATLMFLKLTVLLFPASDFRHPVTTPAFHLLVEALSCPVGSAMAVAMGLALCAVAYEFVGLSKRYVPEVVHYLHGLIQLAIPRSANEAGVGLVYPFRPVGPESQLLVVGEDCGSIAAERIKLSETELSDSFRVSAFSTAVQLLADFWPLWKEMPAAAEIYEPVVVSLKRVPLERYHSQVKEGVSEFVAAVEESDKNRRKPLMHEAKRPKPLRLYEPMVEEYFEGKKKRVGSKEKQERDKLQHKLKREMKGAIREIRKDNSFLARQQLKEQIDKDTERKRKVKELMASLADQEGEVKKMKGKKKK